MIGGVWHIIGDSGDGFIFDDHESGEIVGDMFSLGSVFEEWCEKFVEGVLNDCGRCDDRHGNSFSGGNFFGDLLTTQNAYCTMREVNLQKPS